MEENTIHLKKDNILRLWIEKEDGTKTGECLEFDLDDLEIFDRFEEIEKEDKRIRNNLKTKLEIIENERDVKLKGKAYSQKQVDLIKAEKEFFKAETDLFNKFLGENGVEKLLYGRKMGWTTLGELNKIVSEQIEPMLKKNVKSFKDIMQDLYGTKNDDSDVME